MSCDQSRINTIENNLQQNPSSISDTDLIYYLQPIIYYFLLMKKSHPLMILFPILLFYKFIIYKIPTVYLFDIISQHVSHHYLRAVAII